MMLRYLAGVASALLLIGAGVVLFRSRAASEALPPAPRAQAAAAVALEPDDDPELPAATSKSREERRFGRYDKDRDGIIAREEYLASRRKAFAKLDVNGDGRLAFEEWSAKAIAKFGAADRDRSSTLSPIEFATTAVKRSSRRPCVPPATVAD